MTMETAERARDILAEIKRLNDIRENLDGANLISIDTFYSGNRSMNLNCEKGAESGRYVKYLLDGIDCDIANLRHELKRL